MLALTWIVASATDPSTDRGILEIFYFACNGENWNDNANWINNQMSICNWTGVECALTDVEQVQRLRLPNNGIACSVPPELFSLPDLEWLDLRSNNGITVDFTSLNTFQVSKKLEYLILSDTDVASLDGIQVFNESLTTLNMAGCELSGPFPESILSLSALKHLDLAYNFLSGSISDGIDEFQDLRTLGLNHNFFNGQLPSTLGNLQRLSQVQISFNMLSGTLPTEMNDMYSLTFVTLNDQIQGMGDAQVGGINGPLLDFKTLQFLFHLDFSNNRLTGSVPPTFLASLLPGFGYSTVIDLRSNRLSGELPSTLARFDNVLPYLADNQIESIPQDLCQASDWLFGQVGEFGCNGLLCPPGTFNEFGRQLSDGFPCWQCEAGKTAPYYGSKSCILDTVAQSSSAWQTKDTISLAHVSPGVERLSTKDEDYQRSYYSSNGLEKQDETGDAFDVQLSALSSGTKQAFGMTVSLLLVLPTAFMLL
jgi:hypothetical protein